MLANLERPTAQAPGLGRIFSDSGLGYFANGLIGFIFSATGPVAIILAVGTRGGLSQAELASWVFGVFFVNGLITIAMSWLYRQPLGFFWTIPGTVLVGPALAHLSFAEVIGAYYATSLLILVLGATGSVKKAMQAVLVDPLLQRSSWTAPKGGIETELLPGVTDPVAAAVTLAIATASAVPAISPNSASRLAALSFFESVRPTGTAAGSRITAAATTGPASGPRPTSSTPASGQRPSAMAMVSRLKSALMAGLMAERSLRG